MDLRSGASTPTEINAVPYWPPLRELIRHRKLLVFQRRGFLG